MCSRPSSRRIDDGPITGYMTCRGSPTLNCAGFHLNTCSTRSRSATWTSSPMITSFVRKTRPYRSRIASRVSSGRTTPRTVCARRGRRGPGTSDEDLMRVRPSAAAAQPVAVEHPLLEHAVDVQPHRAHHAAEHRVVARHDQQLEELRPAELGLAALHELLGRRPAAGHLADDRQRERLARLERVTLDLAALERADLLLLDADKARDRLVLHPFVLGVRDPRGVQDRELAQHHVEV